MTPHKQRRLNRKGTPMKNSRLLAALVAAAFIVLAAADASAMYNPATGTFLQRDPGPGGPARVGTAPSLGANHFTPRDPFGNYADGPNLYRYVGSNPLARVDPEGLWGCDVHHDLVKRLSLTCGQKEAVRIANASQGMDEDFHDAPSIVILGLLTFGLNSLRPEVQEDYSYHFPGAGPPFPGQHVVVQGFANATVSALFKRVTDPADPKGCNLEEFRKFLHMLADSWSHGGAAPDFFGHPKGVPI